MDERDGQYDNTYRQSNDEQAKMDRRKQEQKKKLEPSLKWKALEVDNKDKKEEKQVAVVRTSAKSSRGKYVYILHTSSIFYLKCIQKMSLLSMASLVLD